MLKVWRVAGDSLEPEFQNGDFVITSKVPILLGLLRPGDAVVLRHPHYGVLIKLVERLQTSDAQQADQVFVTGLTENSVDSRRFGPLHRQDLLGKVLFHFRKP